MKPLLLLPILATAAFAAAPLTDSQRTRIETADDHSQTVDEAAFYALLEHAQASGGGEVGAVVPNYQAIRKQPDRWRGRLVLIEGMLEMAMPDVDLARSGWEHIAGLVIRTPEGRPVIVYLTHPPELHPTWMGEQVLRERGARLRVAARFYKRLNRKNRAGEPATYSVFVGQRLSRMETHAGGATRTKALVIALLVLLAVAFVVYRIYGWWRSRDETRRRFRLERGRRRAATLAAESKLSERNPTDPQTEKKQTTAHRAPLPDDPVDALHALWHDNDRDSDREHSP